MITYDRQGSGLPANLFDMVLVGFSLGIGEVTRYLGTSSSTRMSKAAISFLTLA